jgi:phage gpG-like protein
MAENDLKRKILSDMHVKLTDEFDRNFTRQGFFDKKWPPTRDPKVNAQGEKGSILIVTGAMRRSIRSEVVGDAVVFSSNLPYTALHNEGGTISGTQNVREHTRKVKGKTVQVKGHQRKVHITIPERRFIGDHANVRDAVEKIATKQFQRYSEQLSNKFRKQ